VNYQIFGSTSTCSHCIEGQAYYYLKDFEEAKNDLAAAAKLDPKNADVKKMLKTVQDQLTAQKEKEKKMYSKMFG